MENSSNLQLREPIIKPSAQALEQALGASYNAYQALQEASHRLLIQPEWQWYTPYKAWFQRGQYHYETARGTKKEKTLYWLYVFQGYFNIAVWFKEKNRTEILKADIKEPTRELIMSAKTMGKLPTFPVEFTVTTTEPLDDIYTLIECKKLLEK